MIIVESEINLFKESRRWTCSKWSQRRIQTVAMRRPKIRLYSTENEVLEIDSKKSMKWERLKNLFILCTHLVEISSKTCKTLERSLLNWSEFILLLKSTLQISKGRVRQLAGRGIQDQFFTNCRFACNQRRLNIATHFDSILQQGFDDVWFIFRLQGNQWATSQSLLMSALVIIKALKQPFIPEMILYPCGLLFNKKYEEKSQVKSKF